MHRNAAVAAIRKALVRLFTDLAETAEVHSKIENMVREIIKSIEDEGLRFVGAQED